MTGRIRVVQAIENLDYGGMERVVADLARELPADRFEVHVFTLEEPGHFAEGLDAHARLHRASAGRHSMLRPTRLARQLAGIAPDIVHTHSGVWFKLGRAARIAGCGTVHTDHGRPKNEPRINRWVDRIASSWTDYTIAVSDDLRQYLRGRVVGANARMMTIENGIDTNVYRPAPSRRTAAREALSIEADATVITCIGRLEPVKRHDVMIEAFARLRRQVATALDVTLVLAGHGSWADEVAGWVRGAGLDDHVRLLGWTDDPLTVLHASDVFTLSSDSEGTSISLLEAMAAGLCPVVTDVGGNRTVLGETLSPHVVPRRDPQALADAWAELVIDPDLRARVSRAARQRVCDRYSVQRMVDEYAEVYAEVVAARRGG